MRIWMLGLVVLACVPPVKDEEEIPCEPTTQTADAGTRWHHMTFNAPVIAGQNVNVEREGNRSRITFVAPGPFTFTTPASEACGVIGEWSGVAIAKPIAIPAGPYEPALTRPGKSETFAYDVTNLTDDDLPLEITSSSESFRHEFVAAPLTARATRRTGFAFMPTEFGLITGQLEFKVSDWTTTVELRGNGGGPDVIAPTVEAGLVATGFTRPDIRFFEVKNNSALNEPITSDIRFTGASNNCADAVTVSDLPEYLVRGETLRGEVFIHAKELLGAQECVVTLGTWGAPISFRVKWEAVNFPPCDLSTATSTDGGATYVSITTGHDECYFTHPRFEPANAGTLDIDWSEKIVPGNETLVIPVITSDGGHVVLNSTQFQSGVTRIEVTK